MFGGREWDCYSGRGRGWLLRWKLHRLRWEVDIIQQRSTCLWGVSWQRHPLPLWHEPSKRCPPPPPPPPHPTLSHLRPTTPHSYLHLGALPSTRPSSLGELVKRRTHTLYWPTPISSEPLWWITWTPNPQRATSGEMGQNLNISCPVASEGSGQRAG